MNFHVYVNHSIQGRCIRRRSYDVVRPESVEGVIISVAFVKWLQENTMSTVQNEEVIEIHHWTDSLFSFATTRNSAFRFRSGQFTMLGLDGPGQPILRAYSVASAPYEDRLEFFRSKFPTALLPPGSSIWL